jgi:hypothetical protein
MDKEKYVLGELKELNKEHKKIQKSQIWWLIGAICGLIFFPITILVIIVMIMNATKMGKIRKEIKEKQREVDILNIDQGTYKKQEEKSKSLKQKPKKKKVEENKKKKGNLGEILSWIFGIIFILAGFGGFISEDYFLGFITIILGFILLPFTNNLIERKFNWKIPLGIKIALFIIAFIFIGMSGSNEKKDINTHIIELNESFSEEEKLPLVEAVQKKSNCPKKGFFQFEESYFIDLCLFNDENMTLRKCEQRYDIAYRWEYEQGMKGFIERTINKYKCDKCGDCTEEQLRKMEEKKVREEEAELAYNKSIEEARIKKEEEQKIKEEQEKIKEQERIELEKNIESQSQKNEGYIYIKNISGVSRQWQEDGIIYEFPFPTKEPVKVPTDIGRKLLTTGKFELVMV